MNDEFNRIVALAVERGILPADQGATELTSRPWPVILMTALGAWLAALPLLGVMFLTFDGLLRNGPGAYIVGLIVIAGTTAIMRAKQLPLFAEQLCLPVLLVGGGTLGVGLFRDMPYALADGALALAATVCALLIRRSWLRTLLGAAACILVVTAVTRLTDSFSSDAWLGLQLAVLVWLAAQWRVNRTMKFPGGTSLTAAIESIGLGWVLATLAGLAWLSGMTFLVVGTVGDFGRVGPSELNFWAPGGQQFISLGFSVAAAAWVGHCWPPLRNAWCAVVAVVLMGMASVMPSLGAVWLLLAVFATAQRWRLAAAVGVAVAWIVGAFYYGLQLSLADKAMIMGGAGIALAASAWFALKGMRQDIARDRNYKNSRGARIGVALSAAAVLIVANTGIWQKQNLIAAGKQIFIELAPADPRSLMQGDFMRLNFGLLQQMPYDNEGDASLPRSRMVVKVDLQGIASFARSGTLAPAGADEIMLELGRKKDTWTLGTDAWFFKQGEADRWARARYGEFRVDASGHLLLVGLRGPKLEPL